MGVLRYGWRMEFVWDPDKNAMLQRTRGLGFEVIVTAIVTGGLVAISPIPTVIAIRISGYSLSLSITTRMSCLVS